MHTAPMRVFERPPAVLLLALLLTAWGVIVAVRGASSALEMPRFPGSWPLLAGALTTTVIKSALALAAAAGLLSRAHLGWTLAGVLLCTGLLGSILSFLQLTIVELDGAPLYMSQPAVLQSTIAGFVASLALLFLAYSSSVREYLKVTDLKVKHSLIRLFIYGFLLNLLLYGTMILPGMFI